MLLSFSTTVCPKASLPEATRLAVDAGFESIELFRTWTESSPVHPDWSVLGVREHLTERHLALSGLNVRNITGKDANGDRSLRDNLSQLDWDIDLARALGLGSANTKGGARTKEARDDLIEGVNALLERHDGFQLNLGNHHGNRLQDIDDYQSVMPDVPDRAKVLADTGHLLSSGVDIMRFAEAFADRIGLVHLRDQRGDVPVPFGQGDLPFRDLIALLRGAGYDGTLVIELEKVDWGDPLDAVRQARETVQALL